MLFCSLSYEYKYMRMRMRYMVMAYYGNNVYVI